MRVATARGKILGDSRDAPVFAPRSASEARVTVEQVLGPLIDYDQQNNTELLHSLRVFLQCNRSWTLATARLFVHRQTLVYRIGRVEELTGRRLNDTGDVAELWLALRAYYGVA